LKVVWVVEALRSSGGVRVVVECAEGLASRGHDVRIVTKDLGDGWIRTTVPVEVVATFEPRTMPDGDVAIATWFPTVVPTTRSGRFRKVFHLCQGYEGLQSFLAPRLAEIEEAYGQPIPKIVVSPHLADLLRRRFPGPWHHLPPSVRSESFRQDAGSRTAPAKPPRIGLIGPIEWEPKGIRVGLEAVRELKRRGWAVRLFRASPLPLSEGERSLVEPDGYGVGIRAADMPNWYHGLDLLLFAPFPEGEGLGLPPLEAMASGIPVVATDIPSLEFLPGEAAARVRPGDPLAIADAAERLLRNPAAWREQRARGLEFAATLRPERTLDVLERILCGSV
jgi:glycosyltransferase involved in cell wall biosynthesis